jgi:formate hydrogenlyase transcriptional activator
VNNAHALIVDDDVNNVQVLAELLAVNGFQYTQVLHPNQLADTIERMPTVNIIFLDLEMPGMNGYDVLETMQADGRFNDVPFVAYTVHSGELHTAHQRGFHSFLMKPLDPDIFSEQLARILQG